MERDDILITYSFHPNHEIEVRGDDDDESLLWLVVPWSKEDLSCTSSGKLETEVAGDFFKMLLNFPPSFEEDDGEEGLWICFLSPVSRTRDWDEVAPAMITGICRWS